MPDPTIAHDDPQAQTLIHAALRLVIQDWLVDLMLLIQAGGADGRAAEQAAREIALAMMTRVDDAAYLDWVLGPVNPIARRHVALVAQYGAAAKSMIADARAALEAERLATLASAPFETRATRAPQDAGACQGSTQPQPLPPHAEEGCNPVSKHGGCTTTMQEG